MDSIISFFFLCGYNLGSVSLHAMIQKGSGNFEILCAETVLVIGRVFIADPKEKHRSNIMDIDMGQTLELSGKDVYSEFTHRGHKYSAEFKAIKSLTMGKEGR